MDRPVAGRMLPGLLEEHARDHPNRVVIQETDGETATCGELHDLTLRWAAGFASLGVRRGDRVAVMIPPSIAAYAAWLGLGWLGALEVPVHPDYRGQALQHILVDSGARIAVIDPSFAERFAHLGDRLPQLERVVTVGDDPAALPFPSVTSAEVLRADRSGVERSEPRPWDLSSIMYTGGTTGFPKGVLVPWGRIDAAADAVIPGLPGETYYTTATLFHVTGKFPLMVLRHGGRIVVRKRFSVTEFWSDIRKYGCTFTLIVGSMALFLYQQPALADDADNPLKEILIAPLIPQVPDFERRFAVRARCTYGLTEITSVLCALPADRAALARREADGVVSQGYYCGRVRPGFRLRVVDEKDRELAPGEVGELIAQPEVPWVMMQGYWGAPDKTIEAWRNLWFHTGDLFTCDEVGNYFFIDRRTDRIRRRGENISSALVEQYVRSHPAVQDAAAIAVHSPSSEDDLVVFVERKPDAGVTVDELRAFLQEEMPRFMLPERIELIDDLPRTHTQRVKKSVLREMMARQVSGAPSA